MKQIIVSAISIAAISFLIPQAAWSAPKSNLLKPLAKNDTFLAIVDEVGTEWADGNVSTGTTEAEAALLKENTVRTAQGWKTLAEVLFADLYRHYQQHKLPANVIVTASATRFRENDVQKAVRAVVRGHAYNPKNTEAVNMLRRQTWKMLRQLGKTEDLQTLIAKTRVQDDVTGEMQTVELHAYVNRVTGKVLLIFTAEGTI